MTLWGAATKTRGSWRRGKRALLAQGDNSAAKESISSGGRWRRAGPQEKQLPSSKTQLSISMLGPSSRGSQTYYSKVCIWFLSKVKGPERLAITKQHLMNELTLYLLWLDQHQTEADEAQTRILTAPPKLAVETVSKRNETCSVSVM